MTDVKDYIKIFNFDREIASRIVDRYTKSDWESHSWADGVSENKGWKFSTFETSEPQVHWPHNDEDLLQIVRDAVEEYQDFVNYEIYNRDPGLRIVDKFSPPRLNSYGPNDMMRYHVDHIHTIWASDEHGIPALSMVGCLNDDYEGGEFVVCDKEYKLKCGEIICFPSCFMYPHEVKPVTKGIRRTFVCWGW